MIELTKRVKTNYVFFAFAVYSLTIFIYKDFNIPSLLGYGFLAIVVLLAFVLKKGIVRCGGMSIAFGVIVIFETIAILSSYFLSNNTNYIMYIPALFLCYACILIANPNKIEIKKTLKIWVFVAIILAIYVIIIALHQNLFFKIIYPFLSTTAKDTAVFQLNLGYGICIGANSVLIDYIIVFPLFLAVNAIFIYNKKEVKTGYKIKLIAISLLLFGAILLENRKSELFTATIVIIILAFSRINYNNLGKRAKILVVSLGAGIIMLPLLIFLMYKAGFLGRYEAFFQKIISNLTTDTHTDISTGRIRLWKLAAEQFQKHPVIGIGWGNFSRYVPISMQSGHEDIFELRNVHNCYLQLLCETGIVGFLLFIIPLFFILFRSLKIVRQLKKNDYRKQHTIIASSCVGYQLFFLIVGFIDPCWYKLIFLCFYSLTIIMIDSLKSL